MTGFKEKILKACVASFIKLCNCYPFYVNQPTVNNGELAAEGLWLWPLAFVTGDRSQGTVDTQEI